MSRRLEPAIACMYRRSVRGRPQLCRRNAVSYISVSGNSTAPPSPAVISLPFWKLNAATEPSSPTRLPCQRAPCACAASWSSGTPVLAESLASASMSARNPAMCTGMIARVREVTAAAAASTSMLYVCSSTSTGTATAPSRCAAWEDEMKVKAGTMTSEPGPTPMTCRASSSAWVPFVTARAWAAPWCSANSCSKESTSLPPIRHHWPCSSARMSPSRSFSSYCGHWGNSGACRTFMFLQGMDLTRREVRSGRGTVLLRRKTRAHEQSPSRSRKRRTLRPVQRHVQSERG